MRTMTRGTATRSAGRCRTTTGTAKSATANDGTGWMAAWLVAGWGSSWVQRRPWLGWLGGCMEYLLREGRRQRAQGVVELAHACHGEPVAACLRATDAIECPIPIVEVLMESPTETPIPISESQRPRCQCLCGCRQRPSRRNRCPRYTQLISPGCAAGCWDPIANRCHMCLDDVPEPEPENASGAEAGPVPCRPIPEHELDSLEEVGRSCPLCSECPGEYLCDICGKTVCAGCFLHLHRMCWNCWLHGPPPDSDDE